MLKNKFELTHVEHAEKPVIWAVKFSYIVFDAILFAAGIYLCINAALMRVENNFSFVTTILTFAGFVAYLVLSRSVYVRFFKAPFLYGLILDLVTMFILVVVPCWLVDKSAPDFNFSWLPLWWNQLPDLLSMFAALSPLMIAWLALGFLFIVSQVARKRTRFPLLAIAILMLLVFGQYAGVMGRGARSREMILLFVMFAFPFQAAVRGRPRLFARSVCICLVACFTAWHLLGFLPFLKGPDFFSMPGVQVQYPVPDGKTPVQTSLLADVAPDPAGGMLYVAGGRSGKLFSIDLGNGKISETISPGADLSQIEVDRWSYDMYVLDSREAEVFRFQSGSMHGLAKHSLVTEWGFAPRAILPFDRLLYVSYSENPGLAEFDTTDFRQEGGIEFHPQYSSFRTGGFGMFPVSEEHGLIAVSGPHEDGKSSLLMKIDPIRFKVKEQGGMMVLPDIGNTVSSYPDENLVFTSSLFREQLYVIDIEKMSVSKTVPAAAYSNNIVFDPTRRLLFTAGRFDGRLVAASLDSGEIVKSDPACNNIRTIKLDEQRDRLWLVCIKGVVRIDLPYYLGEKEPENKPVEQPKKHGH